MNTGNITIGQTCNVPHFSIHWNVMPNLDCTYAEWFAGIENRTLAVIYSATYSYALKVEGDLQFEILDSAGMLVDTIVSVDGLHSWGIASDEELDTILEKSRQYRLLSNPWIAIYNMKDDRTEVEARDIFSAMQYVIYKITLGN